MPTNYHRNETDWRTTLHDAKRRANPRVDLDDLVATAAHDLATYHPALEDPYRAVIHLEDISDDHYDAAMDEADRQFDDNDSVICRVYNVAWCAIYLWYVDQFTTMLNGGVRDVRLADPKDLT